MVFGPLGVEFPFVDHGLFELAALSHTQTSPFLFLFGFHLHCSFVFELRRKARALAVRLAHSKASLLLVRDRFRLRRLARRMISL